MSIQFFQSGNNLADDRRYLTVYNYQFGSSFSFYKLGLASSVDGRNWYIEDEPVIPMGTAGQWDAGNHQFPNLLQVDGVLYMYYSGLPVAGVVDDSKIGLARSFDRGLTWEKYASNPVLDNNIAWENNNILCPRVLYDRDETDANKRWKMWYAGSSFGEGIGYAYSADGLSWTKSGANPVLELGSSGQWDDFYICPNGIIRRGNEFILFYGGNNGSGTWSVGYATFTDPEGTYTKHSSNPIFTGDGISSALTANLTSGSATATVSDATVFPIGAPVWVFDDSNCYLTRVIKRNSATSIELEDAAPVTITTADSGAVRSVAYNSVWVNKVKYDDGYKFDITTFQPGVPNVNVHELGMLAYANDDLGEIFIDYGAGVQIPITVAESQNDVVSRENFSVVDTYDQEEARHKPAATPLTFNDTEGNPADVTTGAASDGTSQYAARRDHVHHRDTTGERYRQFVYDVASNDVDILTEDGDAMFELQSLE